MTSEGAWDDNRYGVSAGMRRGRRITLSRPMFGLSESRFVVAVVGAVFVVALAPVPDDGAGAAVLSIAAESTTTGFIVSIGSASVESLAGCRSPHAARRTSGIRSALLMATSG